MPDVTLTAAAAESPWGAIGAVVALCAIGALYGNGIQRLWQRRGTGAVISLPRAVAFTAGLAALGAALGPPVHDLAEKSFAGHMVQHMVLIVVAGPLLGSGGAALPISLGLPRRIRRQFNRIRAYPVTRWFRRPAHRTLAGGLAFTAVLWLWHLPALYEWATENAAAHAVEHVSFVAVTWTLWAAVLSPDRHRLAGPLGFLLLFGIGMTGAALGAVLTFAPSPLYDSSVYTAHGDALTDQQLAGLAMWIPMDVVVLGVALTVFGRWLAGLQQRFPQETCSRPAAVAEVLT